MFIGYTIGSLGSYRSTRTYPLFTLSTSRSLQSLQKNCSSIFSDLTGTEITMYSAPTLYPSMPAPRIKLKYPPGCSFAISPARNGCGSYKSSSSFSPVLRLMIQRACLGRSAHKEHRSGSGIETVEHPVRTASSIIHIIATFLITLTPLFELPEPLVAEHNQWYSLFRSVAH